MVLFIEYGKREKEGAFMRKKQYGLWLVLAALFLALCSSFTAEAATVKLNKKALTLEVGGSARLKMQGTERAVEWSSKDPAIAAVSSSGTVKAAAVGETTVYAKLGSRQYACKVTVVPAFEADGEAIADELDGRIFSIDGQSFQVQEEEISEIRILSKTRSKDQKYLLVRTEVYIDRTIASMISEVKLLYRNTSGGWKLRKVSEETRVEEWNLEGLWKGGVTVYDYSRNSSEYRDLTLDIFDWKDDGIFSCEASLVGEVTDEAEMAGELDLETGELTISGLNWIHAASGLAKELERKGKVYSFYAVPDFADDAFVSNVEISTRATFADEMLVEKVLPDEADLDGTDGKAAQEEVDEWGMLDEDDWNKDEAGSDETQNDGEDGIIYE